MFDLSLPWQRIGVLWLAVTGWDEDGYSLMAAVVVILALTSLAAGLMVFEAIFCPLFEPFLFIPQSRSDR